MKKWHSFIPAGFLVLVLLTLAFAATPFAAIYAQDELLIQLTANGFVPGEVQHAAGTFEINVENSTMSGEYTLMLKSEDGAVLKELKIQKGSAAWTVTLQAGQYTLVEASHPQWLCQITVQ